MGIVKRKLSKSFKEFFDSEKASGVLLFACTVISLAVTNSPIGENYSKLWHFHIAGLSIEHWINDGLMAIFFLLVGLELKRELWSGELSDFKNALLPVIAAGGGIVTPALIHFIFNHGTATQAGIGIPMATDIAFALGVLALLGRGVPASLKVFLTALAVMDDLGAIIVIAVFYSSGVLIFYLLGALCVFAFLIFLSRFFRVLNLIPYLIGGVLMWFLILESGVHATIAGVLLAFAIPSSAGARGTDEKSPSDKLEHALHQPVSFFILPVFALCNTGIIGTDWFYALSSANSLGIILGLLSGKPIGITLFSFVAVSIGICKLPLDLTWRHIFGAGLLGGIGFTMSIFITNLAFTGNAGEINGAKMAVLCASLAAGTLGFFWLKLLSKSTETDDLDALDFAE